MSTALLTDDLWTTIQQLLPPEPPKLKGGRPRLPDRAALTGILFVLKTGCPWQSLPRELGCGVAERHVPGSIPTDLPSQGSRSWLRTRSTACRSGLHDSR